MFTSLFAQGTAKIEVGRFGGTLEETGKWLNEQLLSAGFDTDEVKIALDGRKARVSLRDCKKGDAYKLLDIMAKIDDLHGDPPDTYFLEEGDQTEPGKYVRTGSYND